MASVTVPTGAGLTVEAEYPSIQDLVVALYDTEDKAAIDAKRAEIKLKYPKPVA